MLTILTQKGFVEYTQQGRAYLYRAIIQPEGVRRETVSAVVDKLFAGSSRSLVLHLIESDKFTIEEAQDLKELLDQRLTEDTNA